MPALLLRHLAGRLRESRGGKVTEGKDHRVVLLCRAANCRRLAEEAVDASAEKLFLEMARSYELLAARYGRVSTQH